MEKCLKDVREATPRVNPWGVLGDPHGGNEDIKDAKIRKIGRASCRERVSSPV